MKNDFSLFQSNGFAVVFLLFFLNGYAADGLQVGTRAPVFSLSRVGSETAISSDDYLNKKVLIVHFWKSK